MKRTAAILLLLILLFNIIGYRFFINYYEQKAVNNLDKRIDDLAFNKNELSEFEIPLQLPYFTDRQEENVSGEIEYNGKHYQYVKRKIENNILHIWCISNKEKNDLVAFKNNLARSSTNQSSDHQQKSKGFLRIMQMEFLQVESRFLSNPLNDESEKMTARNSCLFSQHDPIQNFQPPKV